MTPRTTRPPAGRLAAGEQPSGADAVPGLDRVVLQEGPYRVRFARGAADLERVQRLRFRVFNQELGEGLEESWRTGRDEDRFDRGCHHLMLEEDATGELVGTYRMQTAEMAGAGEGFYCDQEFDLATLAPEVREASVELGRACIADDHRNGLGLRPGHDRCHADHRWRQRCVVGVGGRDAVLERPDG